jgi:hypothetical protein
MSSRGLPTTTVRMAVFARDQLRDFVDDLSTTKAPLSVSDGDLMGALILAARRSPIEAVKAVVATYLEVELELAAAEAVGAFLRHFGAD